MVFTSVRIHPITGAEWSHHSCQEQRLLHEEVEEQQTAAAERAKTISHWDLGGEVFRKKKVVGTWLELETHNLSMPDFLKNMVGTYNLSMPVIWVWINTY